MSKKKALITGITGQDGSYLAELLLSKDYEVHGIIRRSSTINTDRIDHLMNDPEIFNKNLFIKYGDVTDSCAISKIIYDLQPDEIYNLAAQSHVAVSYELPLTTLMTDGAGTLHILDAVRNYSPHSKVYQASTSELFGGMGFNMPENGYTETSQLYPRSPYGCAKLYGFWITKNYRESYNLFSVNGILFNHESPNRGETFVSRKITIWYAKYIKAKKEGKTIAPLRLGNLTAERDWSHAKDMVKSMYLILQHSTPEDFVVSSNECHTVKEFVEICFKLLNKTITWEGEGINEVGICDGEVVVKVDPKYFRPAEVQKLLGDSTKIRTTLGWKPEFSFMDLVKDMVFSDLKREGIE